MEGIVPLTISCRVVSQRAINFSEFYDSSRHGMRDSPRKRKSHSFVHPFARSSVPSFVRSLPAKRPSNLPTRADAVLPRLRIDMHCPRLFSSCFSSFSNRRCPCDSGTVRLCRGPISRSSVLRRSHSPTRRRFYLIALLCFIEQLLRSRAVCFFTVTTGNSCVCDFWV